MKICTAGAKIFDPPCDFGRVHVCSLVINYLKEISKLLSINIPQAFNTYILLKPTGFTELYKGANVYCCLELCKINFLSIYNLLMSVAVKKKNQSLKSGETFLSVGYLLDFLVPLFPLAE